ncbi:hypothetical protein B296_00046978 [Ensete ventricosum]|uniref:EF-hand domain-containing protein n=1 Tax=Ensete ventricosum TaxID=4639 RepID=A0A426X3D5_ENSVE|nr:hypothetical protein B296_00046978 [Ensete ventricosum]
MVLRSDGEEEMEMTPLQKHVAFFDRNNDGIIYPSETYRGTISPSQHPLLFSLIPVVLDGVPVDLIGFRAIGSSVALSAASAVFINGFLSPKTSPAQF